MDSRTMKDTGWRGSRELWLEAALEALVEGGVDAVKIQPLASRLNLSRTSFYWFFKDRDALLEALLDLWNSKNTGAIEIACAAYAETAAEAVLNLIHVFIEETTFEARFDFAVRGWAIQSDAVKEQVKSADARRLSAIRAMFERHGCASDEADVRASTVYLVQIGYISMQISETLETRLERAQYYVRTFVGEAATASELARFRARFPT